MQEMFCWCAARPSAAAWFASVCPPFCALEEQLLIITLLEHQHQVVGVANDNHIAFRLLLAPRVYPLI
jgi:hypothetical protein